MNSTIETQRLARNAQSASAKGLTAGLTLALILACPAASRAAPPLNPLPAPYFCFDPASPSVTEGFVSPADVLAYSEPHPTPVVDGCLLGLCGEGDSLTGLSSSHSQVLPNQSFVLLFSVDRATVGLVPPDPALIAFDVPFNPQDQAWRGQAAGDMFMSSALFTLLGGIVPDGRSSAQNSTLARNNFDEGGTEFGGHPAVGASAPPTAAAQDNVVCLSYLESSARGPIARLYFTAYPNVPSPLLERAGRGNSGADVFFNSGPHEGGITELYAPFFELGLLQADSIDALMVFDLNMNGFYDGPDCVLFSLTPESPSVHELFGASPVGAAADVFIARPGLLTQAFANAEQLGLGTPTDNIDALELWLCDDPLQLAGHSGIRALRGDLNCDINSAINVFDIDPFVLALTNPPAYHLAFPGCHLWRADVNRDGLVNAFDIDPFVLVLVGGG